MKPTTDHKFFHNLRRYVTVCRMRHPYLFCTHCIAWISIPSLYIWFVSSWDIVIIFLIACICLVGLLFLVTVWTLIEQKRIVYNENEGYTDAWKKIKIIVALLFMLAIVTMIILTWSSEGDETTKKCIATTVSILSLFVGGEVTCQIVGRGSIFNGPVNIIRQVPINQSDKDMQDLPTENESLGADVELDNVTFNPRKATSYNNRLDIEE